jgi:hypothetical protein
MSRSAESCGPDFPPDVFLPGLLQERRNMAAFFPTFTKGISGTV